ncbi:MAG: PDZ domain-containing protein [Acidobacteriia bacterium]|nr:PDZ domain-containing protein [Terriglobia bacterium]
MKNRRLLVLLATGLLAVVCLTSSAAGAPSVSYLLAMPRPSSHLYVVTIHVEEIEEPFIDVAMPAWSPGAYIVGNYAKNVQEFSADDGAGSPLRFEKLDKQTWRIHREKNRSLDVHYKYYAGPSSSPFGGMGFSMAQLNSFHASFAGTSLFMYVIGKSPYPAVGPVKLTIEPPAGWRIYTALQKTTQTNVFTAENYDTFVDAPIEITAEANQYEFEYQRVPYHAVVHGNGNYDPAKLVEDLKRVVATAVDLFGAAPYSDYTFFFHLRPGARGSGGLEHLNSTSISAGKYLFTNPVEYRRFLFVCEHEFFHLWNVKRIRPRVLGPFDYSKEQNTRDLYVSEGMTSYYGGLLLKRSGLWSQKDYFDYLATQISTLQNNPGRHLMSAEMSSWQTWSRSDNSTNNTIDYYNKGELLGLILDLELRVRTGNRRTLDDVFRYLLKTVGLPQPGFEDTRGFQEAVELMAKQGGASDSNFNNFFDPYVRGVEEIPWDHFLHSAGLTLEEKKDKPAPYLGFTSRTEQNQLVVSGIRTGTPAWDAGLDINDVLLSWNDEKIDPTLFDDRLKETKVGDTIKFTLFRGDRLLTIPVQVSQDEKITYSIKAEKEAGGDQQKVYLSWLNEKEFSTK